MKALTVLLMMLISSLWLSAFAQVEKPPFFEMIDRNGVNLHSRDLAVYEPALSIGDPANGGLQFKRKRAIRTAWDPAVFSTGANWFSSNFAGYIGADTVVFLGMNDRWSGSTSPTGSGTLVPTGAKVEFLSGKYYYTGADGTVAVFDPAVGTDAFLAYVGSGLGAPTFIPLGLVTEVRKPDGEIITWHYVHLPNSVPYYGSTIGATRLQSVTNNLGYQIHFQYKRDTATSLAELSDWYTFAKATAIDNSVYSCSATAFACSDSTGANWPYLVYGVEPGGIETVQDRTGATTRYLYQEYGSAWTSCGVDHRDLKAVRSPHSPSLNDISIDQCRLHGGGMVDSIGSQLFVGSLDITTAAGSWQYDYLANGFVNVTGPNGYSQNATRAFGVVGVERFPILTQVTTNGQTVTQQFDAYARPIRVDLWDGSYTTATYDARSNIAHIRRVAKPGSGLADINTYATYATSEVSNTVCVNAKTCNKPVTVTDARGFVTTYAYDAGHAGLLTETKPAPGSGPYASIQPQTRYTYDATGGITRVATVKSCRTTASCAGGVDEKITETTYTAKRVPSLVVTRTGNNTTAYTATNTRVASTYTPQGDVESVDGPLSGSVDKVWNYYDTARRLRVTVAPDPDAGGSLKYRATRTTYDADGNPTMSEQGSVSAPANCSAANNFCASTMTVMAKSTVEYDSFGRKIRDNVINVATGQPEAVTQYSYDTAGLVECVATRMNPTVYGSLPAACTQSTTGSFGEDRIARTTYTASGDPSVIQSGYGTSLVRNERTFTYLAPGQTGTVKDAANNLTTYEYDGFDRLKTLRYPLKSTGANASAPAIPGDPLADFEQYTYDAAGNPTSERRRDGAMIYNGYDNLNRLITKGGSTIADVTNGYDNFDNLISASHALAAVSWTYDALGRVQTEVQPNGTVSYAYDTAGRRTQLTYPGSGFYTNYQYYDDGRLKLIGLNGATTGSNVLATYYDDQLGRRASMCRGTGTTSSCSSVARTTLSYDAVSRLSGLSHDLTTGGSTNDLSRTFSYSPASQLITRTATTALYEPIYGTTYTDAYVANGLNQYTSVAGAGLTYDGRGNTTNDTTKGYSYDGLNRLTSATNGAALAYDPTGRLMSVTLGGATTKFLYDGTLLIAEYNGSNTLLRRYVHGDGIDDPIVWYDSSGTTNKRNLFKDEQGSIVVADTGSAVTTIKYDEYGNPSVTGSIIPRFQYTGQAWLSEIGLYYYKARIYNPDLGRFMQTDPIGYEDQMNLYAYVGNDPMNGEDPSGKYECYVSADGTQMICESSGGLDTLALWLFLAWVNMSGDTPDDIPVAGPGIAQPGHNNPPKEEPPPPEEPPIVYPFFLPDDRASRPTGSSRARIEVKPGTNNPDSIGGRDYSGHSLDRTQGRGIPPSVVENTIQHGKQMPGSTPGTTIHYDPTNNVTVVTNSTTGRVVTVRRGPP